MRSLLVSLQHDAEPAVGISNDVISRLIPTLRPNYLYLAYINSNICLLSVIYLFLCIF